jgi:hypothetical protein
VSSFNNRGGWKEKFPNPAFTYVVAIVEYHDMPRKMVELCILGAQQGPEEVFSISTKTYITYRASWLAQGQRMQPSYEFNAIPTMIDSDNTTPPPVRKPSSNDPSLSQKIM